LTIGVGKPRTLAKSAGSGGGDLIKDLKSAIAKGGGLKKIELDEDEKEKRGIVEEVKFRREQLKKRGQVDEESEVGSIVWKHDKKLFVDTLHETCLLHYDLIHIVFDTIDQRGLDWSEAVKLIFSGEFPEESLHKAMLNCGFTVQSYIYRDETKFREYNHIICPFDLPVYIHLKLIQAILKAPTVQTKQETN